MYCESRKTIFVARAPRPPSFIQHRSQILQIFYTYNSIKRSVEITIISFEI